MTVGQCNHFVISFLQLVLSQPFYFNYLLQKKLHQQICSSPPWSLLSGKNNFKKQIPQNWKYTQIFSCYREIWTKFFRENYLSVSKWFKRPGFYRTCALYTLTRMIYNLTQVGFQYVSSLITVNRGLESGCFFRGSLAPFHQHQFESFP